MACTSFDGVQEPPLARVEQRRRHRTSGNTIALAAAGRDRPAGEPAERLGGLGRGRRVHLLQCDRRYYERPTTVHPFYGDVRSAEAIAADAALEALVTGVEAPFLPLDGPDEGVTPALGGRVDGALPESTDTSGAGVPRDAQDTLGAWDAPADSYKPPLGDRVDAALDALADPEPYTPQLGGRVDAALDALTTWEDSSRSEASWDTEWAVGGRRRRRTHQRRAPWTSSPPR